MLSLIKGSLLQDDRAFCRPRCAMLVGVPRLPRELIVYFALRGPKESDADDFDSFSVSPGARRTRRQKQ